MYSKLLGTRLPGSTLIPEAGRDMKVNSTTGRATRLNLYIHCIRVVTEESVSFPLASFDDFKSSNKSFFWVCLACMLAKSLKAVISLAFFISEEPEVIGRKVFTLYQRFL